MNLLLDSHLLLWAAGTPEKLSSATQTLLLNTDNILHFSAASLWEIVIKSGLGREDFAVDPQLLRRGLLENGYHELPITAQHTLAVMGLPAIHRDPFDRLLVAQAQIEGFLLLTTDETVAKYPGPIRKMQ